MNLSLMLLATMIPNANATARIGVQILDGESFEAIPSVSVSCRFFRENGGRYEEKIQKTDESGRSAFSGGTTDGHVIVRIKTAPAGYHAPVGSCSKWWNRWNAQQVFQPENLIVTQYLSKVGSPVPLVVCEKCCLHSEPQFKDNENVLSFDLMKGDWVKPAGGGEVADIVFRKNPREANGRHTVTATFPGEGNGVTVIANPGRGVVRLRMAPENGYRSRYEMWYFKEDCSWMREPVLAFRIRTKTDEKGNVVAGHYGKIYGGMKMEDVNNVDGAHTVKMLYYLNPTPLNRNLEWDCKTNLNPTPQDGRFRCEP